MNERRFRAIYETLSYGVIFQDRDGRIVDANPAAENILGVTHDDHKDRSPGDPSWQSVDDDENPLPTERHPAIIALRTGQRVRNCIIGIFNPRMGERRWIQVDSSPLYESGSRAPYQAYTIFSDITEQRQAERELRQSKLHLALAQRIASVGSAAIDFRTGKWDWSDETYRIYGVRRDNFTPSADALAALVHPEDREELLSKPALARKGITPPPLEYRIRRPDGEERILRRIATLVRGDAGEVLGIVGTVRDVTDLHLAEREKSLLQNQLYHAQRLDALGTLAGGIAHDLNNTLVPILALSEAIATALPTDDPRRAPIELIHEAGIRARDLVAQVLAFARREIVEHRAIDVKELLQSTMQLIRASVPASIEIAERMDLVRPILGDPGQLHQVIVNLVANAAQAIGTAPGIIELSVTEASIKPAGDQKPDAQLYVLVSIRDSGCGMTEAVQARIFEPFFTTKKVGSGLGLGLSVVHGIVAAHGGRIHVTSSPGNGSQFNLYLPMVKLGDGMPDGRR
jgi:PAS domain S-box-containing protein